MAVNEVSLMGVGQLFSPDGSQFEYVAEYGSAVEVAPGVFLTAAHVFRAYPVDADTHQG